MDLVEENKLLRQTLIRIKYASPRSTVEEVQNIASKTLDYLEYPEYPKEQDEE